MNQIEKIIREFIPHRDEAYIPDLVKAIESCIKTEYVRKDSLMEAFRSVIGE